MSRVVASRTPCCAIVLLGGVASSYVPPVATLLKWFPDRKGFAAGSTIMGCAARGALCSDWALQGGGDSLIVRCATPGCIDAHRYGGGAMIAAPLFQKLLDYYGRAPEYLGPADAVSLVNEGGRLFAQVWMMRCAARRWCVSNTS